MRAPESLAARRLAPALLLAALTGAGMPAGSEVPPAASVATTAPDRRPIIQWPLYTAPEGVFSLRLPGVPTVTGRPPKATYQVRLSEDVSYYVIVLRMELTQPGVSTRDLLLASRRGALEPLLKDGGKVIWSEFGRSPAPASITFLAEGETPLTSRRVRILYRIVLDFADRMVFMIGKYAPAAGFQESVGREFVDSFALLPGKR